MTIIPPTGFYQLTKATMSYQTTQDRGPCRINDAVPTNKNGILSASPRACAVTAVLWLLAVGLSAASLDDQQKLASARAGFAFKLLKELARERPGANLFVSPFCASSVLQMACNGAAGQTKAEMEGVLGTAGLELDAVDGSSRDIGKSLNARGTNIVLTVANAIWYRKGTSMRPEFVARSREFFGATVDALDFSDPRSVSIMDAWASEKTHGKIRSIAGGLIDTRTELFLANAIYFKGRWEVPFDVKCTKDRLFHLRGGRQKKVPMMEDTRKFTYRQGTGYQAVRLAYQGWSMGMYVFLPERGSSPERLLAIMSGDTWQRVTEPGFSQRQGTVVLPRFKLEDSLDLKRSLNALGVKAAFGKADFSRISSQTLSISKVRQQTFVEVNEEGTEAAAATVIPAPSGIEQSPPKPFQMIVDRPFVFLIEDQKTRRILFMGVVFNPDAAS